MQLKPIDTHKVHIGNFMHLVSAYKPSKDKMEELWNDLQEAVEIAKRSRKSQIVEQDSLDFLFIVYPSGAVGLYGRMGLYEIVK